MSCPDDHTQYSAVPSQYTHKKGVLYEILWFIIPYKLRQIGHTPEKAILYKISPILRTRALIKPAFVEFNSLLTLLDVVEL